MKQIYFITTWGVALCALLNLTACGNELEELGYVPAAIGDNSHTTIHHNSTESGQTNEINESYTGMLTVSVNGESTAPAQQTIGIERVDDTHIHFLLKNFMLADEETTLPVGTIRLENIELHPNGENVTFSIERDIIIEAGDAEGYDEWFGPLLGPVPIKLQGTVTPTGMDIEIDIDMMETLGQIIHVDFVSNQ